MVIAAVVVVAAPSDIFITTWLDSEARGCARSRSRTRLKQRDRDEEWQRIAQQSKWKRKKEAEQQVTCSQSRSQWYIKFPLHIHFLPPFCHFFPSPSFSSVATFVLSDFPPFSSSFFVLRFIIRVFVSSNGNFYLRAGDCTARDIPDAAAQPGNRMAEGPRGTDLSQLYEASKLWNRNPETVSSMTVLSSPQTLGTHKLAALFRRFSHCLSNANFCPPWSSFSNPWWAFLELDSFSSRLVNIFADFV